MPPWHVQENKWRAARYGLDAIVILDDESTERLVTDDLADEVARLEPVAERLGCSAELASVLEIPVRGASYQRQRAVAEATDGDLVAVVDSVVRELRDEPRPDAGLVAALGLDHLEADAEQPDRPVVLDPVEQRDRGARPASRGRWSAAGRVRLRVTVKNGL